MNFSQAKQLPIVDYLTSRGIQPKSVDSSQAWYYSPFRSESSPSFKVDTRRNVWYDHGVGQGGTIIDLVQMLDNLTATEVLHQLSGLGPDKLQQAAIPHQHVGQSTKNNAVVIKSVKLLNNPALIGYAESRKIPVGIARRYLSECYYSIGERNYFALGFANDRGGYELRNALWHGSSNPKGITTLPIAGSTTVSVFEGFFDMLSALVYFKKDKPAHAVLVLNSLSFLNSAIPTLGQYERVNLFLDKDVPGQKAVQSIKDAYPNTVDYSATYYPNHKDFNELLTKPTV